jgi:uncharacterized protein (DUF433 family)
MSISAEYVDIGTFIDQREDYRGGRPFIVGTGVTVDSSACRFTLDAMGPDELAEEFNLSLPAVMAALSFYLANQEQMDAEIAQYDQESDRLMEEHYARYGRLRDRFLK